MLGSSLLIWIAGHMLSPDLVRLVCLMVTCIFSAMDLVLRIDQYPDNVSRDLFHVSYNQAFLYSTVYRYKIMHIYIIS